MKTFLPKQDPLKEFKNPNPSSKRIENIAKSLPKLLLTGAIHDVIDDLNTNALSVNTLIKNGKSRDIKLAMSYLSFIAHAYIWGGAKPKSVLPEAIAKPWVQLADHLGRPPILSYASYCLDNWYRINPKKKISLENVALINNFLGGVDEDWFVTIHVCIENAANDAIEAAQNISKISKYEPVLLSKNLEYYHRVRPFIFGTKDNPDLKKGLIYENQFNNKPQFYRGETGAQSSIIPLLDGALGVKHTNDNLRHYLNEMRDYMPPEHRKIIESAESKSQVSQFINRTQKLKKEYNACLEQIKLFRSQHLEYAATYIHKQSQIKNPFGSGGSLIRGTGGTPFMKYLRKHRDETQKHKVK